jgi:hypothetical protein
MAGARTAAELWSEATDMGVDAAEAFSDTAAVERLLARCEMATGISTDRDAAYLQWRYSFAPLRYRVVMAGERLEDGVVVVRLRRRGPALECAVCDVLMPLGSAARSVIGTIVARSGADYLLRCSGPRGVLDGFVPAPQLGPILTWRPICRTGAPRIGDLALSLGDVELF